MTKEGTSSPPDLPNLHLKCERAIFEPALTMMGKVYYKSK